MSFTYFFQSSHLINFILIKKIILSILYMLFSMFSQTEFSFYYFQMSVYMNVSLSVIYP